MQISEVQISIVKPSNGLIAFASIVIDESIYLGSIAIHQKLICWHVKWDLAEQHICL